MNLKVPISIVDELSETVVKATGMLDLASGDITNVRYEDYDPESQGLPVESDDYEFTSGTLSNEGKDVEFRIDVNRTTGGYSVSPNELLEIKVRAAKLFAGIEGKALLESVGRQGQGTPSPGSGTGSGSGSGGGRRLH